jgi:hypothetical protein
LAQSLTRDQIKFEVIANTNKHLFSFDIVTSFEFLPWLTKSFWHNDIDWHLNVLKMVVGTTYFFSKFMYFLKIQMDLVFRLFDSEAGVGSHSIVSNLSLLHGRFQEFKSLGKSIEKYVVSIVRSLSLIWIVQVVNIQTFQIQSFESFI